MKPGQTVWALFAMMIKVIFSRDNSNIYINYTL